jgi:hypothetical protein
MCRVRAVLQVTAVDAEGRAATTLLTPPVMSLMKRSLPFVAAALTLTACADSPTETGPSGAQYAARLSMATGTDVASSGTNSFDSTGLPALQERVLPAIPDREFAATVGAAFETLRAQLDAGDLGGARATAAATRAYVDEYALAPREDTSLGDVGAISVGLAYTERLLGSPAGDAATP